MDLLTSCKDKLVYFRIKELKDVLTLLGLSKQGKKQDLVDRILAILSDGQVSKIWAKKSAIGKEEAAKLVDDTYRKMQVSGATDLASKGQGASNCSNPKFNVEIDEPFHFDKKVRCPCGTSLETESMIKSFGREDPSLQIFLPTGPSDASMQSDVTDQADVSNGVCTDDWISLSLGGDAAGNHGESVPSTNGLNSRQPMQSREDGMDFLAGTDL